MARIRTFVAVECPKSMRARAITAVDSLAESAPGIRWVEQENLHLTVKFLGDVEDAEVYRVCQAVSSTTKKHESFSMLCQGVGAFPKVEKPRTVWLGIDDPEHQLEALFLDLESALAELGFPREPRRFHPHVTIGRLQRGNPVPEELTQKIAKKQNTDFGAIPVTELVIFSSELTKDGPIYTPMGRAPLA